MLEGDGWPGDFEARILEIVDLLLHTLNNFVISSFLSRVHFLEIGRNLPLGGFFLGLRLALAEVFS